MPLINKGNTVGNNMAGNTVDSTDMGSMGADIAVYCLIIHLTHLQEMDHHSQSLVCHSQIQVFQNQTRVYRSQIRVFQNHHTDDEHLPFCLPPFLSTLYLHYLICRKEVIGMGKSHDSEYVYPILFKWPSLL